MNVVWIVIDCLRRDRLGAYGSSRLTTPHLDRLAAQSVRFDQCISPHIPTHPAHTTFFSGRDVFSHQIVAQGGNKELDPAIRLLPDLLHDRGFFTAAVDNIGRWIRPAFDRYEEYPRWDHDGTKPWRNGEQVTERALLLVEDCYQQKQPFFLFLHYWDPHTPYLPPPPFDRMFYGGDEKASYHQSMQPVWQSAWFANYFAEWMDGVRDIEYVRAQYDAEVAYTDLCVAHVLNRLEELGLAAETLLIVGADHGEELDDHGCWFDHHGLYDTNVRVPLLVRLPDRLPAGRSVPGMISLLDVAPTVLDLAAAPEIAARDGLQGRSLLPLVEATGDGRQATGRTGSGAEDAAEAGAAGSVACRLSPVASPGTWDAIYLTECTWMRKRGWRTPRWKLIRALEQDIYGKPPVELYDLQADPAERVNLASDRPEVVEALSADMDKWIARRMQETGLPDPQVDQADALRIWQPRFIAGKMG
jgi:arylsulfatase A-like enzyme